MRLQSVAIAGFRGFASPVVLDLNADVVILAGANGSGKTSFFDAILWALSGSVDRLADEPAMLVSQYSPSGEARVEVNLKAEDGSALNVVRRYDGAMHVTVQRDTDPHVAGPAGEALLIEILWPDARFAADPAVALRRSLTRATYLQQDAVRAFVDADTEQVRFQVVGELVGIGRITELQRQLESSRNQWSRATTMLTKELEPLESQRDGIADRLSRLEDAAEENVSEFEAWSVAVASLLAVSPPTTASPGFIERTLSELGAKEQAEARRIAALQRLVTHLEIEQPVGPEIGPIEAEVAEAEALRAQVSHELAAAEDAAAERRRRQVETTEQAASLRALAELALGHLGDNCPVCEQEYDYEATRARLEHLLSAKAPLVSEEPPPSDVAAVAEKLTSVERELSSARAILRSAIDSEHRRADWAQDLETLATQAEVSLGALTSDAISSLLVQSQINAAAIRELTAQGERISLELVRQAERAVRADLEGQIRHIESTIQQLLGEINVRIATAELASQVIDAIRDASSSLVAAQLAEIEPLLQRIFATVDPHPTFRVVNFLTKMSRGRGELWTTLNDLAGRKSVRDPALVLSSSQLNVLAVAIFFALNLAIPTLPLQVVALDDPLQNLDTVNLLGLADLLRRVKATRQVIVSTHDDRLANLLARKLRPVSTAGRTIRIDLGSWTSDGPMVETTEVPRDATPLRLITTA